MTDRFKLIPAVYVILRKDDLILLHQRANSGYHDGMYGLVSGHLEGDERATEALVREAKEEAGITIDPADLKFVHLMHRLGRGQTGQERADIFFECTRWSGEITNVEPHKCAGLNWFVENDLPDNIIPVIKNVLTDVAAGRSFSEYDKEPV